MIQVARRGGIVTLNSDPRSDHILRFMEPTWHDGLSRSALVQLVEGLLTAIDRTVPKLDAVAHHLGLLSQQAEEFEVVGGVADQVADMSDELYAASDRERLREWGNAIDTPDKAH